MESMTVLYTCGKLPANQNDVVFLQVTINPAEQDEYDMADAYSWNHTSEPVLYTLQQGFVPDIVGCPSRDAELQVWSD